VELWLRRLEETHNIVLNAKKKKEKKLREIGGIKRTRLF
jgi:hypothetical protein